LSESDLSATTHAGTVGGACGTLFGSSFNGRNRNANTIAGSSLFGSSNAGSNAANSPLFGATQGPAALAGGGGSTGGLLSNSASPQMRRRVKSQYDCCRPPCVPWQRKLDRCGHASASGCGQQHVGVGVLVRPVDWPSQSRSFQVGASVSRPRRSHRSASSHSVVSLRPARTRPLQLRPA
jgi:hypothetical protein